MATVPANLMVKTEMEFLQFPNNSGAGNVIHSGDAVFIDTPAQGTSTYMLKALATDAQAAAFAGICQDTYDPTNYGVYSNDPVPPAGMMVQRIGIWNPFTTSGETYNPGAKVYIGANAQTITLGTTANANVIGYVNNKPDGSQIAYAGNGSNHVEILLARVWPAASV